MASRREVWPGRRVSMAHAGHRRRSPRVELGRRHVSIGDLLILGLAFTEVSSPPDSGALVISPVDLIPPEETVVTVVPGLALPLSTARMLLGGEDPRDGMSVTRLVTRDEAERKAA